MVEEKELIILSPCGIPAIRSVLKTIHAGAFGVIDFGENNEDVKETISILLKKTQNPFGLCINHNSILDFVLPENVTKIIVPFGYPIRAEVKAEILYQVTSFEEAEAAITQKVSAIVINGRRDAATCGEDSYDIFRKIFNQSLQSKIKIYIQGDVGIHTSAAFLSLGAHGIIFDSQTALFPECNFPCSEGQNLSLAEDLVARYTNLKQLVVAFHEAAYGHLQQAKNLNYITYDDETESVKLENEQNSSFSKLLLWEKQIIRMLQKEKNLSKFTLLFSNDVYDAFFSAFVSIMSAPVGAKGIKIKMTVPKNYTSGKNISLQKLQTDTQNLLAGLKDISPFYPISNPLDIAVIGMECIYPGAANVDEYWRNILLAKNCITEVPESHWNKDELYKPGTTDTDYSLSKYGGFIPTTDFDPVEFGLVPHSLSRTEPSHLLSLLVVKRALQNAGYDNLSDQDFENTSIFMGANGLGNAMLFRTHLRWITKQNLGELPDDLIEDCPGFNEYTFPGFLPNILTGRIANRLNFGGRNYTLNAACASSLATLDIACQELSSGRSDMVVAGGADLENTISAYVMFSSVGILTPNDHAAPFDSSTNGIILGEGIGVIVLKRLEDAERDGNKIYAVIKGMGGSSDGRSVGVLTPSRKGETRAMERAYQSAGILPSEVGLVEAHGTGTVIGDRAELTTLTDLFLDSGALPKQTFIGSVKSQIGHTKCAAGAAGLIKAILSVYHGIIPPTIHIDKLNAYYDPKTSPFAFSNRSGLWNSEKRIAGISAFGFGGTNFHAVIENYRGNTQETTILEAWPSELFIFRGDTMEEAKELMKKTKKLLTINNSLRLVDIAYSLALYNNKEVQISILAGSPEELSAKIDAASENKPDFKIFYRNVIEGKVVFLFSGEGSQYVNMARDLFVAFPAMRDLLSKHSNYLPILFPETGFDDETKAIQEKAINDTNHALPILGIVDFAIAEYLRFLGIIPDMLAGHSYGEIPALCFSGVIAPEDLVPISKARAKAINDALGEDRGKLIAAITSKEDLIPLLEDEKEVWPVNYNSPRQIVLAGTTQGIQAFMKKAAEKKILCREINVDCALHSPLSNQSEKLFYEALNNYVFNPPEIPVWANMTAQIYPKEPDAIKKHIAKHLVQPIKFTDQIMNMFDAGARIFIETGPGRILLGLVESCLERKAVTIQIDNKSNDGISYLLNALGKYLSTGNYFHVEKLFEGRKAIFLCIDDPDQYKKTSSGWLINGNKVVPSKENILSKKLNDTD